MTKNQLIEEKYFDLRSDPVFPISIPNEGWQTLDNKSFILPKSCNIYLLKSGNHIYVGSDGDGDRIFSHKSCLKNKNHPNNYMNNIVLKYDLKSFEYICLVEIPEKYLQYRNEIENAYIKLFNTFVLNNPLGMNLAEFASQPFLNRKLTNEEKIKRGAKKVILINPQGEIVEDISIHSICEKNNLYRQGVSKMIKGDPKITHVKGWRAFNTNLIGVKFLKEDIKTGKSNAKSFKLIDPDGNLIEGYNLNQFCSENNLDQSGVWHLLKGKTRIYKGYKSPEYYYELDKTNSGWENLVKYRQTKNEKN